MKKPKLNKTFKVGPFQVTVSSMLTAQDVINKARKSINFHKETFQAVQQSNKSYQSAFDCWKSLHA